MNSKTEKNIESAEIVLSCAEFDETLEFFTENLGFQIVSIFPADNPAVAVISGYDLRLRLEKSEQNAELNKNLRIRLNCRSPEKVVNGITKLIAPNGVKIDLVPADQTLTLPELEPSFVLNKFSEDADWVTGRAGMRYRDLIPNRQGGRFIASHIHIPTGGEVPDYVHFHKIRFQMIYCYKGWAKLVYEDQGEPFIFKAGDCVLQPPEIRHRVLESSDDLEVIEVSSPAEHETFSDHEMTLPNSELNTERDFSGQKFIHSVATDGVWKEWRIEGFECRDTGIGKATNDLASVKVIRPNSKPDSNLHQHDAEFVFMFILQGNAEFKRTNELIDSLDPGDSVVIPVGTKYAFSDCSDNFEMLEITLPANFETK